MESKVILTPLEGKLGSAVMGKAGRDQRKAGDTGPFQKHPLEEVGHFLVKGRVANFGFRGGFEEGNRTSTYFETYLPQTSPEIRDWVPLRKLKEKKYIIIYYITVSTLTPRQERTPTPS